MKRFDGIALATVFDNIVYHVDFMKMIEEGYLSQMRVTTVETHVSIDNVSKTKQDFNQRELSIAVNTAARNQVIVNTWLRVAENRKSTLVFAVDIQHTIDLCNEFIKAGIDAQCITSKSNAIDRQQILSDFRAQKFPVLINCGNYK